VPESVWSAWVAESALSPRRMVGFVPVYARAADPFGALSGPIPTRYGDGLPSWLTAGLGGLTLGHANLSGPMTGLIASAETP